MGFYINYEECKLTIVTIRYLNRTKFYINYEECKFAELTFETPASNSFILTMRNVNIPSVVSISKANLVLY
ncbi:TPA: hypothetical protein I9084_001567 [Clostridium perfringens]|nr:hypothetical protein [Clostridium perfringens]